MAYLVTRKKDHGICVRMRSTHIYSDHAKIEFLTGPYTSDKIIQRNSKPDEEWCTPHRLLAVRVSTSADEPNLDRDFYYAFQVEAMSKELIPLQYYMDSFAECDLEHELTSGQEVSVVAQRVPPVTPDVPTTCELTFYTTSDDEYEQVCVQLDKDSFTFGSDQSRKITAEQRATEREEGLKSLTLGRLKQRYYSTEEALNGVTACSDNKRLVLLLNRTEALFGFTASVRSERHVFWESEANEATEMKGLRVVKGITYFIATIDCLVAVLAALLSALLKWPKGPWRRWAENFNALAAAHAPQTYPAQDPGTYSPHGHKDGAYPELPGEMPAPSGEVLVEAHTF
nr:hypothetical protein BaRGS_020968 [Batillaria attramentaria]